MSPTVFDFVPSAAHILDREVAQWLGVSISSVRRWRRRNTGPAYWRCGRSIRYPVEGVRAWIAERATGGGR